MGLIGAASLSFFLSAYWSLSLSPEEGNESPSQGPNWPSKEEPALLATPQPLEAAPSPRATPQVPLTTIPRDPMAWNPFGPLGSRTGSETNDASASTISASARPPNPASTTPSPSVAIVGSPAMSVAPSVPFEILGGISGKSLGDGRPFAFLRAGNDVMVLRPGDEIDGYRVEEITSEHVKLVALTDGRRHVLSRRHQ